MGLMNPTVNDLKRIKDLVIKSFENDIIPLFDNSQRVGAGGGFHFGIIRQVMTYIEYCGAIYCGWAEKNSKGQYDTRKVTTSEKAIQFIEEEIGKIDGNYIRNGRLLYCMFRHGTTHLLRPHRIKRKRSKFIFSWKWYSGGRTVRLRMGSGKLENINHLDLFKASKIEYELPVSIECIINDTYEAISGLFDYLINVRKSRKLPIKQRRALTFIAEGIIKRGDI